MNKKTMKLISVIAVFLCVVMSFSFVLAAVDVTTIDGQANLNETDTKMSKIGNDIATIVRNVGLILTVILLMVIGIKYIMGSASEKAEYKKTMMPYVIGVVLLIGATAIAQAVISFGKNVAGA